MSDRVLIVDDDSNLLLAMKRQLRKQFSLEIAEGGRAALETIRSEEAFAVVVSDMRMPGMDGIQLLQAVREISPDTVRIMLTGNADQKTAIDAVNDGRIFRFLNKPCPAETFAQALRDGQQQYRLITAERELLSKTLSGSVSLMADVLSLVNPAAFGRASGVRRVARLICQQLQIRSPWEVEIAAMLCQVGCVTVPESVMTKLSKGIPLAPDESEIYRRHPAVGQSLVAKVPRLRGVAQIIAYQEKRFDGVGPPDDEMRGQDIPLGARILKVALDFEQLISSGCDNYEAFRKLRQRTGWYDPQIVDALIPLRDVEHESQMVTVSQLQPNMVLDQHVLSGGGEVLVSRGQVVTDSMCERLRSYAQTVSGVRQPIRVCCPLARNTPSMPILSVQS
ncbi:MAG: response regulator [Pirellulaceae bacterium]